MNTVNNQFIDHIIEDLTEFDIDNLLIGYYEQGIFKKLQKTQILKKINDNNYNVNIAYNIDNNINKLLFTLGEYNIKWNILTTAYINKNIFTDELKMDIIINDNINPVVNIFDDIQNTIKSIIRNNNTFNKRYNVNIKSIYTISEQKKYINNIRFNYYFNNNIKKIATKIILKKVKDNKIIDEIIKESNINKIVNKKFHILPILHFSSLFIKVVNNKINIYPQLYIKQIILYKANINNVNKYNLKSNIVEDDYIFESDDETDENTNYDEEEQEQYI
jgi:nitrogen regulatory protein PII